MNNNRQGKAAIWNKNVIKKMRSRLISPQQRLIFEISLFTGERIGAITKLKVSDCYRNDKVLDTITFGSATRKSTKHGEAATRQVAVHLDLKYHLEKYTPPTHGYLFPSDRSASGHITTSGVDKYWRSIFADFDLSGYSTHSSRRWVINQLRKSGIGIVTIAEAMGMNINTVRYYLDDDPIECAKAIATLTI